MRGDIKRGPDPGVSPLTSLEPRGQIHKPLGHRYLLTAGLLQTNDCGWGCWMEESRWENVVIYRSGESIQKRPCCISWQTGQRCCLGLISWQCYCNICVLRDFWDQNFLTPRGHRMGKSKRLDCWMSMANVWLVVLKGCVLWACPLTYKKKIFRSWSLLMLKRTHRQQKQRRGKIRQQSLTEKKKS